MSTFCFLNYYYLRFSTINFVRMTTLLYLYLYKIILKVFWHSVSVKLKVYLHSIDVFVNTGLKHIYF